MKYRNITGVFISILMLSACSQSFWVDFDKPHSLDLTPPPGPPEFQQGWSDGCESGMSSYSSQVAKTFKLYRLKQDPKLRNNKMYYQIWKDAFLYCALYLEVSKKRNV